MKNGTKRITRLAFFAALALIMSVLESMLPPLFPLLPGAKMGLSNVVTLTAVIILGYADAAVVQLVRCLLSGIITGGLTGLLFSLPAGFVSLAAMILLYKFLFPKVSLMGISFIGAVLHNITQVGVACLYLESPQLIYMLPYYILAGIGAGFFVGLVSFFVVKYLPKRVYM